MDACCFKREVRNAAQTRLKNGRPAMHETCPVCGAKLFRVVSG